LNEDIVKELVGDARVAAELEKEWDQLAEDRLALRQIFPSGESKVTNATNCWYDVTTQLLIVLHCCFLSPVLT